MTDLKPIKWEWDYGVYVPFCQMDKITISKKDFDRYYKEIEK